MNQSKISKGLLKLLHWCFLWSNKMELIETYFLTMFSNVVRRYSVTLGGSTEHFTANHGVSACKKYSVWVAMQFGNFGIHEATLIMLDRYSKTICCMWQMHQIRLHEIQCGTSPGHMLCWIRRIDYLKIRKFLRNIFVAWICARMWYL